MRKATLSGSGDETMTAPARATLGVDAVRSLIVISLVTGLAITTHCACEGEPRPERNAAAATVAAEHTLAGRLLLPPGEGSRGVEIVVTVSEPALASDEVPGGGTSGVDDGALERTWVRFDEQGRFEHSFRGVLERVVFSTGLRFVLHEIDGTGIPDPDQAGRIDLGEIDLRDRILAHRLVVRPAEQAPPGEVRMALCFGLPPVGPSGEQIALGSRQFPPIALGSEVAWLLPHDVEHVYFLVERPDESRRDEGWWTGSQQLFGPFHSDALPDELVID